MSREVTLISPSMALNTDIPDIIELLEELNLDLEDIHFSEFFTVKENGELIGTGRIRVHDENVLELCSLGVREDKRTMGIGKAIIRELLKQHPKNEVWAVTEIPGYFELSGFTTAAVYPEILNQKLNRCRQIYDCKNPVVMVCQPQA